jgi:hypothetical protein
MNEVQIVTFGFACFAVGFSCATVFGIHLIARRQR